MVGLVETQLANGGVMFVSFVIVALAIGTIIVVKRAGDSEQPDAATGYEGTAESSAPNLFETIGETVSKAANEVVNTITGKLNAAQIAVYAAAAGFRGADLVIAVAIALAESSGNPRAYNPEVAAGTPEGQGSKGLWQIYTKVHPEFAGWDLYDPQQNAHAAYSVYRAAGFSFRPWSTFKFGNYLARMNDAQQGVSA